MLEIKINLDISSPQAEIVEDSIKKAIAFLRNPKQILDNFSASGDNSHQKHVKSITTYKDKNIISHQSYKNIMAAIMDKTALFTIYYKEEARDKPSTSLLSLLRKGISHFDFFNLVFKNKN